MADVYEIRGQSGRLPDNRAPNLFAFPARHPVFVLDTGRSARGEPSAVAARERLLRAADADRLRQVPHLRGKAQDAAAQLAKRQP